VTNGGGSGGVGGGGGSDHGTHEPARSADVAALERQIVDIRGNLTVLVDELQRRRHEALDVRLQLRRHPLVLTGVALGLGGLVTLAVMALARRHRRRQTLGDRWRRLRRGLKHIVADPDASTGHERPWRRVLAAAGTAAAAQAGRRLARRLIP
jgi:hypothetical protein